MKVTSVKMILLKRIMGILGVVLEYLQLNIVTNIVYIKRGGRYFLGCHRLGFCCTFKVTSLFYCLYFKP